VRQALRLALGAAVALAVVAAAVVAWGLFNADRHAARRIDVPPYPLVLPTDAAALAQGEYLFRSRGCAGCHGTDGAGRVFAEGGGLRLASPNISPGAGSVVARYAPTDWERALRHGVAPGGRPMRVMPSDDYNRLSDADLGALVSFVRTLPPAAGGPASLTLPLPARVLYGLGMIPDAADRIDHTRAPSTPVPARVTVAHGEYVAQTCIGCHGSTLAGGRIPGTPPDWPPAARLIPGDGSVLTRYPDAASLQRMFATGRRPDGSEVKVMPFETLRAMNDTDVQALSLYLHRPAAAAAAR
jgi:mono/diheme cytochrome c family protein